MTCEYYLLLRLGEVFDVHCAVRVGVLVGANCSRKKMHQSFSFCRRVSEVGQPPSVIFWRIAWIKGPPRKIGAEVGGGVLSSLPDCDFNRLERSKNCVIEI